MKGKFIRNKNIKILTMCIELFLCTVLATLGFIIGVDKEIGLVLPNELAWIPLTLFGLSAIFTFLEFHFSKPFMRVGYIFLSFILIVSLGQNSHSTLNGATWLLGLLYIPFLIGCIVGYIINSKGKKQTREIFLKQGLYSKKQYLIITYTIFALVLLCSSFVITADLLWKTPLWKSLLIAVPVVFIILFVVIIKADPIITATLKFKKDACYKDYADTIDRLLKENIHEDTIAVLNSFKADALFTVNGGEACALFDTIKKPLFKNYIPTYEIVEIEYYIWKKDYAKAKELIELFKNNNRKNAALPILERSIIIENSDETIENIEKVLAINTQMKLVNMANANSLMIYYQRRNQEDKAKEYAKFILEQNTDLEELNKQAREILGKTKE